MHRHWKHFLALLATCCAAACFGAETLYATSLRASIEGGSFIAGNLYQVDPSNASARLVGAIRVGDDPVGVVALATHPRTGAVYGITAGLSRTIPRALLSVDLDHAVAQFIARLPERGTDLGFGPEGTLYMWAAELRQIVKVSLEDASIAPVGKPIESAASGALAITADGREALVAVNGAQGELLRVDLATGEVKSTLQLTGAPFDAMIDNLTFSPSEVLYGVNSDGGAPSKAALVIVDTRTGVISRIGPLPDDVRGLIFAPERAGAGAWREEARKWILVALGGIALLLIAYAFHHRRG
jgi:hypothetical protein